MSGTPSNNIRPFQITHETFSSNFKFLQKNLFNNGIHLAEVLVGYSRSSRSLKGPGTPGFPSSLLMDLWNYTLNNHKSHESLLDSPRPSEIPLEHPWKPIQGPPASGHRQHISPGGSRTARILLSHRPACSPHQSIPDVDTAAQGGRS